MLNYNKWKKNDNNVANPNGILHVSKLVDRVYGFWQAFEGLSFDGNEYGVDTILL